LGGTDGKQDLRQLHNKAVWRREVYRSYTSVGWVLGGKTRRTLNKVVMLGVPHKESIEV
jgi:hypothetical protein